MTPDATGLSEAHIHEMFKACSDGSAYWWDFAEDLMKSHAALAERLKASEAEVEALRKIHEPLARQRIFRLKERTARLTTALEAYVAAVRGRAPLETAWLLFEKLEAALTEPPDSQRGGFAAEQQE